MGLMMRFLVRFVSGSLMAVSIVMFGFLGVGPHVFGYRTLTVLTGSMAPGIKPGSVVVVTPEPVAEVRPGQVIAYQIPIDDHRVVTHRVVSVAHDEHGSIIETKGDANASPDPWRARVTSPDMWTVRLTVPILGSFIRWFRSPILRHLLVTGIPVVVAITWLWQIWLPSLRKHPLAEVHV